MYITLIVNMKFVVSLVLVVGLFACGLEYAHAHAISAPAPNIVFIMADDMGWGEVGVYPATSPVGRIDTPHIDSLASQGLRFTNAYAGYTVCAPSRTTLFTGRHSGHFPKYNLPGTSLAPGQAVTTAQVLKNAGYKTALVGKSAPLMNPVEQGFDYFFGQVDQARCHNMYPDCVDGGNQTCNIKLSLNQKNARCRSACMSNPENYNYTTDMFQSQALQWLEETVNKEQEVATPFFLYLSFTVPHAGGWTDTDLEQGAPVPTDGRYASKQWPNVEKDHAGVITYLDGYVGQIMSKLDQLGVTNDTIVFFASDNGAHKEGGHNVHFFNSTGGLRGQKRSMYEGGVRSPTLVRWTGKIVPGVSDYPWAFWDLMPTLAELAGADDVPSDIDGHSIVPTLLGKSDQPFPEYLFYTGAAGWADKTGNADKAEGKKTTAYSVRVGKWKAVVPTCTGGKPQQSDVMQVFDLSVDPFETNDLATTVEGKTQIKSIKKIIMGKDVSCQCFQC